MANINRPVFNYKVEPDLKWKDHFYQCLVPHNLANPIIYNGEPHWLADFNELCDGFIQIADMDCKYHWVSEDEIYQPTTEQYVDLFLNLCIKGTYVLLDKYKPDHPDYEYFSRIIKRKES